MNLQIILQSLDRIEGQERRSKLLHNESPLYQLLHQIKKNIKQQYAVSADRMDLHIEVTKDKDDAELRLKSEQLHEQTINLANAENWGFLNRAFVLWTPEVKDYGKTHITLAYFGEGPKPELEPLRNIALSLLS